MININMSTLDIKGIKPVIINFPNGEFKTILEELPDSKNYTIIVQTDQNPIKMIFATSMIINIVKGKNPEKIIVVHPWLSFSRQDKRFYPLEPLSLELILTWYDTLGVTDLIAFDIHAIQFRKPGLHKWGNNLNIHNINFVSSLYDPNYPIMSPTDEQEPFLVEIEQKGIRITYFKKEKICLNCKKVQQECVCEGGIKQEIVLTPLTKITSDKALLIDDIISGGGTMLEAVKTLKNNGVKDINVAVTHGFFDGESAKKIFDQVNSVTISNTIQIKKELQNKKNIRIKRIEEKLKNYLENLLN